MHPSSAGGRLLPIIETKSLHLLNIMRSAPYSVDYASLRHPEMRKHNTQFVQQFVYFRENLSAASMVVCVTVLDIRQRQGPGSFIVASLRFAENAHRVVGTGKYEFRKPFISHPARGLLMEQREQDDQEGQSLKSGLQTLSGVLSQLTVAHRLNLIPKAA